MWKNVEKTIYMHLCMLFSDSKQLYSTVLHLHLHTFLNVATTSEILHSEWECRYTLITHTSFPHARLINEASGGKSGLQAIVGLHHRHPFSSFRDTQSHSP